MTDSRNPFPELTSPRARVIAALNGEGGPDVRQLVLNEVADLEHKLYMQEQHLVAARQLVVDTEGGKREAERLLNEEATRADGLGELIEGLENLLNAGRQAEVARRALAWIQRERHALSIPAA